jgi:tetratricopeptide (TPR) repeat protein
MLGQIYQLLLGGDSRTIEIAFERMLRETRGMAIEARVSALEVLLALAEGDHAQVRKVADKLIYKNNSSLGYYYLAQSRFLCGEYESCLLSVNQFLEVNPHHPDAIYLKVDTLLGLSQREKAWKALETLLQHSKRIKTWLVMAKLVQSKPDFERLLANHVHARENGIVPAWHVDINEYLAMGALRCGDYVAARQLWRESISKVIEFPGFFKKIKPKKCITVKSASRALSDLKQVFQEKNIEMFLVSGTLLGCIREGKLLKYDKDVDVGIWEETPREHLMDALQKSGLFYIQASRAPEVVRVRHVNGVAIDVFYHYRESETYWHGGVKIKWHNKPFSLVRRHFIGQEYLIPEDYSAYLVENYGDWRTPRKDFDSAYDTSNAEVINQDEMAIHAFKGLLRNLNSKRMWFYVENLVKNGEEDFLKSIEEKFPVRRE